MTGIVAQNVGRTSGLIKAAAGGGGTWTLIKTLTASADSTLDFVDGASDVILDSTYPIYRFSFINTHPSSTSRPDFTFNGSDDDSSHSYDVTKTTTFFNVYHMESDASGFDYASTEDLAQGTGFQPLSTLQGDGNDNSGCGEMWLFNPSSTTFVKHFISRFSSVGEDGSGNHFAQDEYAAGYFNATADITAIQFKFASGDIDSGKIKLYGLGDS